MQLDHKPDACLAGKEQHQSPKEAAELGQHAIYREHYRASVRFYADAFKGDPELADNGQAHHRYNAACSAALAAASKGTEAPGEQERAGLRRQALDWPGPDL